MSDDAIERELQRGRVLSVRLPANLFREVERDAALLGVSLAGAGRMRFRTGHVPTSQTSVVGSGHCGNLRATSVLPKRSRKGKTRERLTA
jgi:hypothetical protein